MCTTPKNFLKRCISVESNIRPRNQPAQMDENPIELCRFVLRCVAQAVQQHEEEEQQQQQEVPQEPIERDDQDVAHALLELYLAIAWQTPLEQELQRQDALVRLTHEKQLATRRLQDEKNELKRLMQSLSLIQANGHGESGLLQRQQALQRQLEYLEWLDTQSKQFDKVLARPSRLPQLKEDPAEQRRDIQGTPLPVGRNVLGDEYAPPSDCLQYLHKYEALPVYHSMRSRVKEILLQREKKRIARLNAKRSVQVERDLMRGAKKEPNRNNKKKHQPHQRHKLHGVARHSSPQDQELEKVESPEDLAQDELEAQFDKKFEVTEEHPVAEDSIGNQKP